MFVVIAFSGSPPACAGFLVGLLFDPEDGDNMFFQKNQEDRTRHSHRGENTRLDPE
jgi:hypothetical protein